MSDTVFTARIPQGICCLCGTKAGPFRFELRPTGPGLMQQEWPFCFPCWSAYRAQGSNGISTPATAARMATFIRVVGAGEEAGNGHTLV